MINWSSKIGSFNVRSYIKEGYLIEVKISKSLIFIVLLLGQLTFWEEIAIIDVFLLKFKVIGWRHREISFLGDPLSEAKAFGKIKNQHFPRLVDFRRLDGSVTKSGGSSNDIHFKLRFKVVFLRKN